jgi:hypothetical protein
VFKVKDEEVNEVLSCISGQIDELKNEYMIARKIPDFVPVVNVYPVADDGFIALFHDPEDSVLASAVYMDGEITFTSYGKDSDLMH